MKFVYDADKSREIEQKLIDKWDTTQRNYKDNIHVYDTVYCPVKAYCKFKGVPRRPTKQNIGMFVFGVVAGKVVQELYPKDEGEYVTNIKKMIWGHIDVYEDKTFPLEIKHSRKRIFKRHEVPQKWIEQLMTYMASENKQKGWLVIINIFSNQISCFRLEMAKQELESQRTLRLYKAYTILRAVKDNDPNYLTIQPDEYQWCVFKRDCPRRQECKEKSKA